MHLLKRVGLTALGGAALLVMACGDGSAVYPNNDGIPNNCEYVHGEYYQQNHFARFDNNNHRLMLVDWSSGDDIFELDTNIDAARTSVLEWSPNCKYLVTHQDGTGIFYDVVEGRRVGSFENMRSYNRYNPSVVFDQQNRFATVEADGKTYVLNIQTGTSALLSDHLFRLQFFDYTRDHLVAISSREVAIYDLNSAAKLVTIPDLSLGGRPSMVFSPDHNWLAFVSDNRFAHIVNRDTLQRIDLNIGYYIYNNEWTMALSPDNRWFTIGDTRVNVWDLQSIPADLGNRTPTTFNFPGPDSNITDIHFVDGNVIETIAYAGTSYWDMTTGQQIIR